MKPTKSMPKEKEKQEAVTNSAMVPDLYESWLEKQVVDPVRAKSGFITDREISLSEQEEVEVEQETEKADEKAIERGKAKRRKRE